MRNRHLQATVLYADISHFTTISEQLDPEQVTELTNGCFELSEGVVIANHGTAVEYLGDCIVAVFGLDDEQAQADGPDVDASSAINAVTAAIQMREEIQGFNPGFELAEPLDIHVGIETGEIIAGTVGSGSAARFAMTGDTVRIAAALEDASETGQILVGPGTEARAEKMFEFHSATPVSPRRGTSVPAFELSRLRPEYRTVRRDSERRQATVIFAEISGFVRLADSMPPAALMNLLSECFERLEPTVLSHGGVIDKYIGQSLMALFGVPNAIENAPQQAINAAIEMRDRVREFSEERGLPVTLELRTGINTGLVVAGEIGGRIRRDYSVLGSTVNLASRIKDATSPGSIRIGPITHEFTANAFSFGEPETLELKGAVTPTVTHVLESAERQVHRARAGTGERTVSSELIGRKEEMAELSGHVEKLVDGSGSIAAVVGHAGVGKSRVANEVVTLAKAKGVHILVGRTLSTGANLSFHPFIDQLQEWARFADNDDDQSRLLKLDRAVRNITGPAADDILPFVATLLGLRPSEEQARAIEQMEGEAREKLLFKSIRELYQAMARARPVMLVFEDLHWADESSANLLEALLRLTETAPIFVFTLLRPDEGTTADTVLDLAASEYASRFRRIDLAPLTEEHAAMLVEKLLDIDDLPPATRRLILEKAEGNPFYLEEVVRTLIDQGAVDYVDGRHRITEKIDTVAIPGTIGEVVMSRVDQLPETTRHVIQLASVIGRTFSQNLVGEFIERETSRDIDHDEHLAELCNRQILVRAGSTGRTASGVEDVEYAFTHALAQASIYESLLQKTRKQLHAGVGRTIEAAFSDRISEFYGMLAYHFSKADELEKAEDYLFRAGEEAARSAASAEALKLFEEASRLYRVIHPDGGDPAKQVLLEKNMALANWNKGNLTESIEHFNLTLELLGDHVPDNSFSLYARCVRDVASILVRLYVRGGLSKRRPPDLEREQAVAEVIYARSRAQVTSEDAVRTFIDNINCIRRVSSVDPSLIDQSCGIYATSAGLFAFAAVSFDVSKRFLDFAEQSIRPGVISDRFSFETFRLVHGLLSGDWREELAIAPETIERALRAGQLWDVNTYLGLDCDRRFRRGDFTGAQDQLARLAELRDSYGYDFAASNHDGTRAMMLLEQRDFDAGLPAVNLYYATRHEMALRVLALGTKAKMELIAGRVEEGEATLARSAEIAKGAGVVAPWHGGHDTLSRLRLDLISADASGKVPRSASANARRALRTGAVAAEHRTEAYRLNGTLAWQKGRKRKAKTWWKKSIREGERLGAQPEVARAYAEIARRTEKDSSFEIDGSTSADCGAKALTMFRQLGLDWDETRLERGGTPPS